MKGVSIPLSAPRRFLGDLLHFASRIPTVPVQRRMHLAQVVAARAAAADRPGWPAVFLKAYARVAAQVPELRRAHVALPWPHLYEYPASVAGVAVERDYRGEKAVFFGRIARPDELPLAEIEARLRALVDSPIEQVRTFRKMLRFAGLPRPLRRFLMWLGLNLPRLRPSHFGTFGLSVYSSLGAESLHPLGPLTTTLTYGVIAPDGAVDVRLVYDHRVLDGAVVARVLARLEDELTGAVYEELRAMARPATEPAPAPPVAVGASPGRTRAA
jgi:hypothetical protein